MSVAGYSDPDRMLNRSFHRRNDSGELDVFEAARYFSGYNDAGSGYYNCATYSQRIMRDERQQQPWRGGRVSLDVPMRHHPIVQPAHVVEKQIKEKKHKQPSSPGGKLASFLNSLFNQTGSKKKKSKSTTQSMKDEEESPGGRRKRRISISHFRSSSTVDTKSIYSSSNSGFRTPPPYVHTPAKSYKDFKSYLDHKQQVASSISKNNTGQKKSTGLQNDTTDYSWLDEKLKLIDDYREKQQTRDQADRYRPVEKDYRKSGEVDDGADSDSSSDLFELQNYDLGIYSSGLPVYETTHMDSIKMGAPISNGAL
ncbi:REVERSIBLY GLYCOSYLATED POLYPEPTIDE 3 family protein [Hibiscus syriacus]|uniref:REVERSIBLY GLYCOSYLATED POLYPEPTIDE 3 family protein n=1 Tax=Hibiscus syriacus TaxID=106335 RepID=A0A6A2YU90_HIBSY|nr:protein BIG GRAIN 1-like E isoform X1 [Hibiscus syriacus]KAE8683014.1 REVERSIBLY GLYCOSYLATED POLYPEPTIDE 3 family protein [Hibiscus syriacus]